jgi:hypothetical protein
MLKSSSRLEYYLTEGRTTDGEVFIDWVKKGTKGGEAGGGVN